MKTIYLAIVWCSVSNYIQAQEQTSTKRDQVDVNKEIARKFYQDLWFTNNTDNYQKYVADEYVVHDIGNRKGIVASYRAKDYC